jgi:zinc-finger of transposase IS204/IS1001/IS1096/IS1165
VETNATRMCALLVGLPDITVVGIEDQPGEPLRVHVETTVEVTGCAGCGTRAWVKDRPPVELVGLPAFGRPATLVWRKRRWRCPEPVCPGGTWTETDHHPPARTLVLVHLPSRVPPAGRGRAGLETGIVNPSRVEELHWADAGTPSVTPEAERDAGNSSHSGRDLQHKCLKRSFDIGCSVHELNCCWIVGRIAFLVKDVFPTLPSPEPLALQIAKSLDTLEVEFVLTLDVPPYDAY